MGAKLSRELLQSVAREGGVVHDALAGRADEFQQRELVLVSRVPKVRPDSDVCLDKPSVAEHFRQTTPDVRVESGAAPGRGHRVEQLAPGRMWWFARPRNPIEVLHRHASSREDRRDHLRQDSTRLRGVQEQQARVSDVEALWRQAGGLSVGGAETDVAHVARADGLRRCLESPRVVIDAEHAAVRPDAPAEEVEHSDRSAAAEVERMSAGGDLKLIEQPLALVESNSLSLHRRSSSLRWIGSTTNLGSGLTAWRLVLTQMPMPRREAARFPDRGARNGAR